MSKTIYSNSPAPKEVKALYILGPKINPNSKVLELYNREDCIVVGDGKRDVRINDIEEALQNRNLQIGTNTRIDISAHGKRVNKEHKMNLSGNTKTKDFLQQLQMLVTETPLYVHIHSCYGGTANKDIQYLNPGSIIVTHVKSRYSETAANDDFSHLNSLTRYMKDDNLTPHLQYLYDQLENYQATTFNQKENDDNIIKFKTIRNPAENSVAKIISNVLQQRPNEKQLLNELQNYLNFEEKRFHELFEKYLTPEDIAKFQNQINNINDENVKNHITGTLINLAHSLSEETTEIKADLFNTLKNILDNLNPEAINRTILDYAPLHAAIWDNNLELVKVLLERGANPILVSSKGVSPLAIACINNFVEITSLLLDQSGVDPNFCPNKKFLPLIKASVNENLELVELLLRKGANPNYVNDNNRTPLMIACNQNSPKIVQILLDNGAEPNIAVQNGNTPLITACIRNSPKIVQSLLDKGAEINVVNSRNDTPLIIACKQNSLEIVQSLLDKGAEINVVNSRNNTPLIIACANNVPEIVRSLLDRGAETNIVGQNGFTPLTISCKQNSPKIIQSLLEYGANPDLTDKNGYIPLFTAYKSYSSEIIELLLGKRANPDIFNLQTNESFLYMACKDGDMKIVNLLIEYKANPNLTDIEGNTPLFAACEKGDLGISVLLLNNGADVNKLNKNGDTPLLLACKTGNIELIQLLVERRADLGVANHGETPVSIAEKYNHMKVKAFLEDKINKKRNLINLDSPDNLFLSESPSTTLGKKLINFNESDKLFWPAPSPEFLNSYKNELTNKQPSSNISQNQTADRTWVYSTNINPSSNPPNPKFFQDNPGAKNKSIKIINEIIETATEEVVKKNTIISDNQRKNIQTVLSSLLEEIPVDNLIKNKQQITNLISKGLRENNQQNNNNVEYRITTRDLIGVGTKIVEAYNHRSLQMVNTTTTTSTHKWQSYVKHNSGRENSRGGRGS